MVSKLTPSRRNRSKASASDIRHVTGIPFADQMDPATSLYELAGMVYPGRATRPGIWLAAVTISWVAASSAGNPRPRLSCTNILKPPAVPMPHRGRRDGDDEGVL